MDVKKVWENVKDLGTLRLSMIGGGAVLVVSLLFLGWMQVQRADMTLLYSNLDVRDGTQIAEKLQSMGVPFDVRDGGTQVYVPTDDVLRLRMSLAEAGMPAGGGVGYEIFDQTDALGTTNFVQNVNLLRALEGELSRTIRHIQGVASCRVHVVMPKRELFSREQQQPKAAVVLKMRSGSARLNHSQIQAVQNLVASSVPSLLPDHISILDDRGVLLASGGGKEGANFAMAAEEARIMYETRLARMVESLLEQSVGQGKVRAEVAVELDMNRVTEQSEIYDPEGQVVRSVQTVSDTSRASDGSGGGLPTGVQSNMPNIQTSTTGGGGGGGKANEAHKSEETTNYEISKTVKTAVREMGGVKRLSVAVMIDGVYENNVYKPRSPDELRKLTKVVQAMVGFQAHRGDVVDVVNLPLVSSPDGPEGSSAASTWGGLAKRDWMRLGGVGVLALAALVIVFFLTRPFLAKRATARNATEGGNPLTLDTSFLPGLSLSSALNATGGGESGARGMGLDGEAGDLGRGGSSPSSVDLHTMSLARMEKLRKIEELIAQRPEDAATILHVWMER